MNQELLATQYQGVYILDDLFECEFNEVSLEMQEMPRLSSNEQSLTVLLGHELHKDPILQLKTPAPNSGMVLLEFKNGAIQVRARDLKSLKLVVKATGAPVVATPLVGYLYRISIANEHYASWVNQQALSIDYKNFKNEVHDLTGYDFTKPLNQVWSVRHDVNDSKARVRK